MAKVGAQRAAELTGKSKSTIQRAMNNGKISFEIDNNGRRVIDVSELERAFGLQQATPPQQSNAVEQELERASAMLEKERLLMRVKMLEDQLHTAQGQIEDMKEQRDKWQRQADQVLLTSQHAQKEADQLRDEIKERQKKAEERRQQKMQDRMKRLEAQNENETAEQSGNSGIQGFLKKFKKTA